MMSKIKALTPAVAMAVLAVTVISSAASAQTSRNRYNGPTYSNGGSAYGSEDSRDQHNDRGQF
jgi:hypothetical protein